MNKPDIDKPKPDGNKLNEDGNDSVDNINQNERHCGEIN